MKVMVDGTALLLRSAGVKSVLYHWIQALQAEAGADTVAVYPPMPKIGALDHQQSVTTKWATRKGIAMAVSNQRLGLPFPEWLSRDADIFHCSNQVGTPPRNTRLTATVHDLTCWKMPQLHTAANVVADQRYAERVLKRASGLIAVSEHTRRDAIEVLGIDPDRIEAIPNGVSEVYFQPQSAPLRKKPYVLSLGTIEPRKNIDTLLDAWALVRADLREEFDLVVAGPAGWASEKTAARLSRPARGVEWLGYVAESDLPGLTAGATALAYPSLYEGFGLPLAQAMAAGVACVTSNVSSMPEVAGEGALLVDPRSVKELRTALERVLEDEELRRRLGAAGRDRAQANFRWDRIARQSWRFFHRVGDAV